MRQDMGRGGRRGCIRAETRSTNGSVEARNQPGRGKGLLEFRPWMLALAVFLACALGIAVMEQFGDARQVWAQVTPQDARAK